jgi:hypothetical protein
MEDFQKDQETVYNHAKKFLTAPKDNFQPYNKYTSGNGGISGHELHKNTTEKKLTAREYAIVNSQINQAIVKRLGYQLIIPNSVE